VCECVKKSPPEVRFSLAAVEYGTYETVKAILWPRLSGRRPLHLVSCSLFARQRVLSSQFSAFRVQGLGFSGFMVGG